MNGSKIIGNLIPEIIPNSMFSGKILSNFTNISTVDIDSGSYKNLSNFDILYFITSYGTKYGSELVFLLYDLSTRYGLACIYGTDSRGTYISGNISTMLMDNDVKLAILSEAIGDTLRIYSNFNRDDGGINIKLKFSNKTVYNIGVPADKYRFFVCSYSS